MICFWKVIDLIEGESDQFNIEADCMNKIPNLMDSPEQFANVSHSAFIFREAF